MSPIRPLHGIQGRLRQHIHGLGRHYAVGHWPPHQKKPTPDDFLNELIQSGELSADELAALVDEVQSNYGPYSFLSEFSNRILDKADDVFRAKYGRNPQEHEWPTKYRKLCQALKRDWRCYDDLLDDTRPASRRGGKRDPRAARSRPRLVRETVVNRRRIWDARNVFGGLVFLCIGGVFTYAGIVEDPAALWFGIPLAIGGTIGFLSGLPRDFREEKTTCRCSECGYALTCSRPPDYPWHSCPECGVHLEPSEAG